MKAAEAYVGGNDAALDPAFRVAALTAAVRDRGTPFRDALYAKFVASDDPLFRRQGAQALSAVDTAEAGRETLARLTDKRLQNLEVLSMMGGLFRQPATRALMMDWLEANYPVFRARTGGLLGRVLSVGGLYCTEAEAVRYDAFFRPRLVDLNLSPLDLDRPLAQARQCAAFRAAKGSEITAALSAAAG